MRPNTRLVPTSAPANLRLALLAGAAMLLTSAPAFAQQAPAAPAAAPAPTAQRPATGADELTDEAYEVETLIVEGTREGQVIGDIPAEVQLTPRDIQAYGVSSISELVTALSPQLGGTTGQGGGRPTVLINGARVSSFNEIRDLPTEAILRADILPEEVALKYGYRADQRVLNLVLRPYFRAYTLEGGYKWSTEGGGGDTADAHAALLRIQLQNRFLLDGKVSGQSPLLESGRSFASPRSDAQFRTLISDQQTASLNAVLSRPLGDGISGTINGTLDGTETKSKLGLNTLTGGPLLRNSKTVSAHVGGAAAGAIKGWGWTTTANADRDDSESTTQRVNNGLGFVDTANSVSTSADAQLVLNGQLTHVPAGYINTTIRLGANTLRFKSDSVRLGGASSTKLQRDGGNVQANIDIPLTSVRNGVFDKVGDLSLNLNGQVEQLSDFGQLTTFGGGLNWRPTSRIGVLASMTVDDNAPSVQQLGNPIQPTPNVQVYDFTRGETVVITRIDGGNPNLSAETRHQMRLSLNARPFTKHDFNFTANYTRTRTEGVISSFPTASTQLEAAFAADKRFVRADPVGDETVGRLISIDARPINFEKRETSELRYGFTFRKPLGPQPPQGGGRGAGGPGGAGFRGQGGAGGGQGFQGRGQGFQGQGGPAQGGQGQGGQGAQGQGGPRQGAPGAPAAQGPGAPAAAAQAQGAQGQAPQGQGGQRRQFQGQGQATGQPATQGQAESTQNGQPPQGQARQGQGAQGQRGQGQGGQGQGGQGQGGQGGNPLAQVFGGGPGGGGPPPGAGFGGPPGGGGPGGFGGGGGPGGGGPGGGGPGGGFGGGGGGGGRGGNIQVGLYHTIRFEDEITIRNGVPTLDLLDGASIGQGGGTPRNQLDAQANLNRNGLGLALNARWTQGTKLRGGTQDLDFSAMTTVNLRLFAELRQQPWFREHPFFRGARVTLAIDNLFNQRQDVTDANGATPLNYQPFYLDPQGRTVRASFRKLF